MKTKDLYLNTVFTLLSKADSLKAFAYALITTLALVAAFVLSYFVLSIVSIVITAVFSFVVANFAGLVLAAVLIATLKKMILR